MDGFMSYVIGPMLILIAVFAAPWGFDNVSIAEIRAAEAHCSSHGGIKYIDNDYIQEVVCADGLVTHLSWVMKKYHQTP